MVNKIVVGTLATLNSIISPLGEPTVLAPQTYHFQLDPTSLVAKNCRVGTVLRQSRVNLDFEDEKDGVVVAHISGLICTSNRQLHPVAENLNLPSVAFDESFLYDLTVDRPYIVSAGGQSRVKITRLKSLADLQPISFEWVPLTAEEKPAHQPLTVWLSNTKTASSEKQAVAGRDKKTRGWFSNVGHARPVAQQAQNPMHWSRLSFAVKLPVGGDAVPLTAQYESSDLRSSKRIQ